MKYDYLIVGAGVIGMSIAYELIEKNPNTKIAIIDKEDDVANIYKYMDKTSTQKLINEHLSGEQNRRLFIWSLLNFEEWNNIYG